MSAQIRNFSAVVAVNPSEVIIWICKLKQKYGKKTEKDQKQKSALPYLTKSLIKLIKQNFIHIKIVLTCHIFLLSLFIFTL